MPIPILMPALSPTMEEGTLAKWHVKVGDAVKSGDVIAEIETDKATMEVEAVDEGKVGEIVVEEGTEGVKVNAPIAILLEEGESAADAKSALKATAPAPAAKMPTPSQAEAMMPAPAAPVSSPLGKSGGGVARDTTGEGQMLAGNGSSAHERLFASPLARRLAVTKGVDIAALKGSGPQGRIVKRDIEAAEGGAPRTAKPGTPAARPSMPASPLQSAYDEVSLNGMRKVIARRMTDSFTHVPHFPLTLDIEIDKLLALRKELNAKLDDKQRISVNDMIIRASAIALKHVPDANASYTEKAILKYHHADIAVAVAIPGGLITPIIFAADTKGFSEISAEMKDKAARARERHLKPEEYQGGTFSISNLGMMGIKNFASIINEPHGAILSVGAGEQRAVVKAGALAIATVMSVTITCDHRVVDGAIGAAFLAELKRLIEEPMLMLL